MTSAVDQLLEFADQDDPFAMVDGEIEALKLAATAERFEEHRRRIPALARRADELGMTTVDSVDDLVPLLFSHTTYKTYPISFVDQKRWDRLAAWLETVSAAEVRNIDFSGVEDLDAWVERLQANGHCPIVSSGTSGKNSFLYNSARDMDRIHWLSNRQAGWPGKNVPFDHDRIVISLGPGQGATAGAYGHAGKVKFFARPGEAYCVEEPIRLRDLSRIAATRRAMADGSASPDDVARFESEAHERAARMAAAVSKLAEIIIERRSEPMIFGGLFVYGWQIMQRGLELGIPAGEFHPDTILGLAGGLKGVVLPDGWREQMLHWFSPARPMIRYGMSEITTQCLLCEAGMYHCAPWLTLLMLDESGQHLLPREGRVTGRVAFYDPILEGRWGGIVSGDQATARWGVCDCGRPGPVIEDSVGRYGGASGAADDKLMCSGTVEAYVREAVGE